ncbi:MAG: hypothetical protein Q9159_002898 [Coniocarpon cinnabarinum]
MPFRRFVHDPPSPRANLPNLPFAPGLAPGPQYLSGDLDARPFDVDRVNLHRVHVWNIKSFEPEYVIHFEVLLDPGVYSNHTAAWKHHLLTCLALELEFLDPGRSPAYPLLGSCQTRPGNDNVIVFKLRRRADYNVHRWKIEATARLLGSKLRPVHPWARVNRLWPHLVRQLCPNDAEELPWGVIEPRVDGGDGGTIVERR